MTTTLFGVNLRQVSDGIGDALNYWAAAMRSTLPKGLQSRLTVGEEQLIVQLDKERIHVNHNVHGDLTELAVFDYVGELLDDGLVALIKKTLNRDNDLILMVPDDVVLSKPIDFPAAVVDSINQALLYEMDKHTPFPKEQIYFDTQITRRYTAKVQVRLYILHQSQVATLLQAFGQAKLRFDRICPQSQPTINLLPGPLRRKRAVLPYLRNIFLGIMLLLSTAVALGLPLYFKRETAIKLESLMDSLSLHAQGEGELWQRRDDTEATINAFIESYPIPFALIYEELSKRLPDDTWVKNLTYQSGKLTIRGESNDAAAIIALINASPLFKNARLVSPIVKSPQNKAKETYHITAETVTTVDNKLTNETET